MLREEREDKKKKRGERKKSVFKRRLLEKREIGTVSQTLWFNSF